MRRTTATDVHTSLKMIMQMSVTKLLSCSFNRLKANMQSMRARDRKTKLNKIVSVSILMSRPSICAAIDDLRLIECVMVVSNWLPYFKIETPRIRNEVPVKVETHLLN